MARPDSKSSDDTICTVGEPAESSHLVLGSKFIAHLASAVNPEAADAVLGARQRRYPDATHHCWAYRVGRPEALCERSSDAGEPSGTAGRPIADALRGAGLENVVCVVTRYFGGTKLGTGGLVRAYGDATRGVIAEAHLIERTIVREVLLTFDHERTGIVYRALDEFGLHFEDASYDARAHGRVLAPASRVPVLQQRLAELALTGVEFEIGRLSIQ